MERSLYRAHVERVLSVGHAEAPATDTIERSWMRCIQEHALDPSRPVPAHIVDSRQLREHREQIEGFLHVARTGMEQLYKRMSPLGYVLLLTDAHGITVDHIGDDTRRAELKGAGLYLGADWSEARAGTCAVGTCIVERAPITCHRTEHFNPSHITLTCNSAPLFDPTGEFLGVLDVSALSSPSARESQYLALQLATMCAQTIEDANFLRFYADRWVLRLGSAWSMVEVSAQMMLAFDGDGVVVGANTAAREQLATDDSPLVGRALTEVFREDLDTLWRIARAGMSSERSALTTQDGRMFYASVQPPRVARRAAKPSGEAVEAPRSHPALEALAGDDRQMRRLIEQAGRLASKRLNILLHGETGTGKEVMARALHAASDRSVRPFVAINCAAIPESLIESELFGYSTGTFTGAKNRGKTGLVLEADKGTLFLDEIGDMPLHLQTRLLRVLSEKEVQPLGANRPTPVDLTVVAASHQDLRRLIAEGRFREDLYYRLCGAVLTLPALRERQDLAFLIRKILAEEAAELGCRAEPDPAAERALLAYEWPGNVRQLRNVLRFALAVCDGETITEDDLPAELMAAGLRDATPAVAAQLVTRAERRAETEAAELLDALRRAKWRITGAAAELGICRATVYRQMKRYGIVPPNLVG